MNDSRTKIGIIFSGQPTPAQRQLMDELFGSLVGEVVTVGALDGLGPRELQAIAATPGESRIVTELADGETVVVGHLALTARLQEKVQELVEAGCGLLLLLSTGTYPGLTCPVPALLPSRMLEALVCATVPRGSALGVVVPLASQVSEFGELWSKRGYQVTCVAADPWRDAHAFDEVSSQLAAIRPPLVVMDCFAYSTEHKERFRRRINGLILLPQEVVIQFTQQLLN